MPSTPPDKAASVSKEASASADDTFYTTLETLSKQYNVAFVAEGTPFPTPKDGPRPLLKEGYIPESETVPSERHSVIDDIVKQVAAGFDYYSVPQGKVYLLMKRYSNPEDLPDVTPDECRNGLKLFAPLIPQWRVFTASPRGHFSFTPDGALGMTLQKDSGSSFTEAEWATLGEDGISLSEVETALHKIEIWGGVWSTVGTYYFHSHYDWIQGTLNEMDTRLPFDPYFHWKSIDRARVFG